MCGKSSISTSGQLKKSKLKIMAKCGESSMWQIFWQPILYMFENNYMLLTKRWKWRYISYNSANAFNTLKQPTKKVMLLLAMTM